MPDEFTLGGKDLGEGPGQRWYEHRYAVSYNMSKVFESGAFGFSADWQVVQDMAAKGVRSCAYDRAGLGFSDPGPQPRDGLRR